MSRAFVKEDAASDEPLPERRISEHPNLVTPTGLAQLTGRARELQIERDGLDAAAAGDTVARDRLRNVERDLRYYTARLASAQVVDFTGGERVGFGARVMVTESDGRRRCLTVVGEDEADPEQGKVSWVSPLGRALEGARSGDTVTWRRPAGDLTVTIEAIERP